MFFKDYLIRQKTANYFSHSLILETSQCCDYKKIALDYLKALTCNEQTPFCDVCNNCLRINNNNYVDFIYLDSNLESISKDDAVAIQEKFLLQASEEVGVKLYVIKNLEKANKFVLNSLLKFIEEPPAKTYALFMTCNNNLILNTIRSRSQIILIQDTCDFSSSITKIPENIIKNVFADYDELKMCQTECKLDELYELVNIIIVNKNIEKQLECFNQIKELSKLEFNLLFRFLLVMVSPKKRILIEQVSNNIKLNINKRLMIHKLFEILND